MLGLHKRCFGKQDFNGKEQSLYILRLLLCFQLLLRHTVLVIVCDILPSFPLKLRRLLLKNVPVFREHKFVDQAIVN